MANCPRNGHITVCPQSTVTNDNFYMTTKLHVWQ
jgi:hypothetical protein